MKKLLSVFMLAALLISCNQKKSESVEKSENLKEIPFAIVIHGGAGTIKKEYMTDEKEKAIREKLQEALDAGYQNLENGKTSLEAIQSAINILENSPLFNAGKGAVFSSEGINELDASIMDGKTLNSGAVAGVHNIKNPINLARLVMDSIHHVMLSGKGAEDFAQKHHVKFEEDAYFYTEGRYQSLLKARAKENKSEVDEKTAFNFTNYIDEHKYGTVGAVAIDKNGNIAAGTSTGGMTNKKYGRIGDAPIIGAGTYANNETCGISSTGTGEYFIRTIAAHEVSNIMKYQNKSLKEGLKEVIHIQIDTLGGSGGMIGLDKYGNVEWDFNTAGMYRGFKKSTGENVVEIYQK